MIRPKHCRAVLVIFVANVLTIACTGTQQDAPLAERDIQEVRNRTVPQDGRLVSTSPPVKDQFGIRATWDIETTSDNQSCFQWAKSQLGPEYHVTAETPSNITFVKETVGDSYSLELSSNATSGRAAAHATFMALAD